MSKSVILRARCDSKVESSEFIVNQVECVIGSLIIEKAEEVRFETCQSQSVYKQYKMKRQAFLNQRRNENIAYGSAVKEKFRIPSEEQK